MPIDGVKGKPSLGPHIRFDRHNRSVRALRAFNAKVSSSRQAKDHGFLRFVESCGHPRNERTVVEKVANKASWVVSVAGLGKAPRNRLHARLILKASGTALPACARIARARACSAAAFAERVRTGTRRAGIAPGAWSISTAIAGRPASITTALPALTCARTDADSRVAFLAVNGSGPTCFASVHR